MVVENLCFEIISLLQEKQKSYNNSYTQTRLEFGEVAFIVRLTDKLNRLKHLIKTNKSEILNESYEDTIKDIIGYCLLELDYLKRGANGVS